MFVFQFPDWIPRYLKKSIAHNLDLLSWWFFTENYVIHHVSPPFGRTCFPVSNHLKQISDKSSLSCWTCLDSSIFLHCFKVQGIFSKAPGILEKKVAFCSKISGFWVGKFLFLLNLHFPLLAPQKRYSNCHFSQINIVAVRLVIGT